MSRKALRARRHERQSLHQTKAQRASLPPKRASSVTQAKIEQAALKSLVLHLRPTMEDDVKDE